MLDDVCVSILMCKLDKKCEQTANIMSKASKVPAIEVGSASYQALTLEAPFESVNV